MAKRRVLKWTAEEEEFLCSNWTVPADFPFLCQKLRNRSKGAVRIKAYLMELPFGEIGQSKFKLKQAEIEEKGWLFLKLYKEHRYRRKARKAVSITEKMLEFLREEDEEFAHALRDLEEIIADTVLCSSCGSVDAPENFALIYEATRRGQCRKCSRSYHAEYDRTLRGRMRRLVSNMRYDHPEESPDFNGRYLEKLFQEQNGCCYYTNLTMAISSAALSPDLVSIDRKDPDRDHVKDNIVLCRWEVNRMKYALATKDFLLICGLVAQHWSKKK